jgi:hypothetical protein
MVIVSPVVPDWPLLLPPPLPLPAHAVRGTAAANATPKTAALLRVTCLFTVTAYLQSLR